ncbi:hypothetical protein FD51_GL002463 [Lacticaseibacillus zeae DSM 20178 = KCTC 3804]|jgi:hypothetical protein|uniref:Uncharacterized protein n=1 Tax=Lacticaseibacillus zeae DSM 20178 = KCTC 3804 TaxID=1423816 RepID=A0A0R1F2Z5_LACZE|nr:hypothetical protein FD51_GL002463 [Lacticaseibacillus zeae DSM 20178 = KCTC 3804]
MLFEQYDWRGYHVIKSENDQASKAILFNQVKNVDLQELMGLVSSETDQDKKAVLLKLYQCALDVRLFGCENANTKP